MQGNASEHGLAIEKIPASDRFARFNALYQKNPDPWNFRHSRYEKRKYRTTLAALPRKRYEVCIEAGCSIGELTALLARRCKRVVGIDISSLALQTAAQRNAANRNVEFLLGELPQAWPAIDCDLIVLSEVLYFLHAEEVDALAEAIAPRWLPGGACILVNWLGSTEDSLTGPQAADRFIVALCRRTTPTLVASRRGDKYRLDVLVNGRDD